MKAMVSEPAKTLSRGHPVHTLRPTLTSNNVQAVARILFDLNLYTKT